MFLLFIYLLFILFLIIGCIMFISGICALLTMTNRYRTFDSPQIAPLVAKPNLVTAIELHSKHLSHQLSL